MSRDMSVHGPKGIGPEMEPQGKGKQIGKLNERIVSFAKDFKELLTHFKEGRWTSSARECQQLTKKLEALEAKSHENSHLLKTNKNESNFIQLVESDLKNRSEIQDGIIEISAKLLGVAESGKSFDTLKARLKKLQRDNSEAISQNKEVISHLPRHKMNVEARGAASELNKLVQDLEIEAEAQATAKELNALTGELEREAEATKDYTQLRSGSKGAGITEFDPGTPTPARKNAIASLHVLVDMAYAYTDKDKDHVVETSLGRFRGKTSADNQALQDIQNTDHSQHGNDDLINDSQKAISLITKAFTQRSLKIPDHINGLIDELNKNINKIK